MENKTEIIVNKEIKKSYERDAGYDLESCVDEVIKPGECKAINTGLRILFMPPEVCAKVMSRSGLALKKKVFVLNAPGIVDSGFTGEVHAIIMNMGDEDFEVKKGDRVAQLLFENLAPVEFSVTDKFNDSESSRRENGFGSTGVSKR